MSVVMFGIKNCDTIKKARSALDALGVDYAFHDYKASGIDAKSLKTWCKQVGWETLLNRAGTTFRKLADDDKQDLNEAKAVALMVAQPSMIKRPVLVHDDKIIVGFKPEVYAEAFR
ncbi:MAG TPA: ArsC family reductase [Xanthobacteraceae bacterium]|nr:ArsC family reductase [Xanthobacteraceae bacterium]